MDILSETQLKIPKRLKIACTAIFILFCIILGASYYIMLEVGGTLKDYISMLFLSLILASTCSLQIVGVFFGVPTAFKFAWKVLYYWSIFLFIIVFFVGVYIGIPIMLMILIKDYREYRAVKLSRGYSFNSISMKYRLKRILLTAISACLLFSVGLGIGYCYTAGFENVFNKLRYSKEDEKLLELYEFEKLSQGYCISSKSTTLSGDIVIPESFNGKPITVISEYAFYDCENVTSVTMPNSIKVIEDNAFKNCINLSEIVLSSELESIGQSAFVNCQRLISIELPDKVKEIKTSMFHSSAFEGCTSLKSVSIGKGFSSIPSSMFRECTSL